jgi:hypothetical protein
LTYIEFRARSVPALLAVVRDGGVSLFEDVHVAG